MKVLIACERSGIVRNAFIRAGHDAMSCDLLPSMQPDPFGNDDCHYQGDVFDLLDDDTYHFDLMIAHPPCTYLCSSGMHWTIRGLRDVRLTDDAVEFARRLLNSKIERISMENSIGVLSTRIRKPDQIIQPYQFGDDASKATCLWLKNLAPLTPTRYVEPRVVNGKKRWANQTDSGQNRLPPSADRGAIRSITYQGIADAMASQWGGTI